MLIKAKTLKGYKLDSLDGEIGQYPETVTGAKPSALLYCRNPLMAVEKFKPVERWFIKNLLVWETL